MSTPYNGYFFKTLPFKRGWVDVEEYIESPFPASDESQPELQRLISDVQGGKPIHSVVVETKDRLTRNADQLAAIEKLMEENDGCHVVTLKE